MNLYLFIGILIVMLWLAGLFVGAVRGVAKGFNNAPAIESSNSREVLEKFNQKAMEVEEKNRRLMEGVKSKMERYR